MKSQFFTTLLHRLKPMYQGSINPNTAKDRIV